MTITFSPRQALGQADRMLYGHFLEHFHRQVYGGVYDPDSPMADADGFRTDVIEALRRIKTPIIRWPGGCYVSAYDWRAGVGRNRHATYDKAWRVEESNAFGTDEFVALCRKIGCEPYICTNAGTQNACDMSDWVEYCNLQSMGKYAAWRRENGHPEPFGVKFWSIGNENWGGHEIGSKDADEWSRLVRESAKMMLRVDPTIQLSAASIANLDWNVELLRRAGCFLDWISIHGYWDGSPDGIHHSSYDQVMLKTGEDLNRDIDRVRAYLTAFGLEKKIKIAYDEWNLRGWFHPNVMNIPERDILRQEDEAFYRDRVIGPRNMNDRNSTYTMADAVFSAVFLNTCLRNCDLVKMACFSPAVNTRGAIFTYKEGLVLRPQYFVFELYANLLGDTVLDAWTEDVKTISGELGGEKRTVDAADVSVTRTEKGYAIAAINKDPKNGETLEMRILDDTVREMRVSSVVGASPDAFNDIDRNEVGITWGEWQPFDGKAVIGPHSVNVIELR